MVELEAWYDQAAENYYGPGEPAYVLCPSQRVEYVYMGNLSEVTADVEVDIATVRRGWWSSWNPAASRVHYRLNT